ncbi:MAG: TonB-dependent siderophore receptor, partial [Comamonas sp.]
MSSSCAHLPHAGPFKPTELSRGLRLCLGTCLAIAAAGAAAQTSTAANQLGDVTVTDQAAAIGGLQKTYSGGQLARGGDLGILGRTDLMNVPFSTTNYTSELIE